MNKLTISLRNVLLALTLGATLSACSEPESPTQTVDRLLDEVNQPFEDPDVTSKSIMPKHYTYEEGDPKATFIPCVNGIAGPQSVTFDCGIASIEEGSYIVEFFYDDIPTIDTLDEEMPPVEIAYALHVKSAVKYDQTAKFVVEDSAWHGESRLYIYWVDMVTGSVTVDKIPVIYQGPIPQYKNEIVS